MKKYIIGSLAFFLIFLSGCSSSLSQDKTDYRSTSDILRLTLIAPPPNNQFWQNIEVGLLAAAEEAENVDILVMHAQGRREQDYKNCFDAAILAQTSGIISLCVDEDLMRNCFLATKEANIPLVLIGVDTEDKSLRDAYCGIDNVLAGQMLGEQAADICGGSANIIAIASSMETSGVRSRIEGFKKAISAYPDMKITAEIQTNSDTLYASLRVKEALQNAPQNTMLISMDGKSTVGAAKALEAMEQKIYFLTFDDDDPIPELLDEGVINVVLKLDSYEMGKNAVDLILKLQKNIPVCDRYSTALIMTGEDVK